MKKVPRRSKMKEIAMSLIQLNFLNIDKVYNCQALGLTGTRNCSFLSGGRREREFPYLTTQQFVVFYGPLK